MKILQVQGTISNVSVVSKFIEKSYAYTQPDCKEIENYEINTDMILVDDTFSLI